MQHFIFIPASILSNYKHRRILFSESLHPLDGSDTRGSCGQHTRDDKERIGHDSALCRREATEDHRSRAGEYEWWSGSTGATLLRREICKKETGTTRNDQAIRFDRAPSIGSFSEGA